MIARTEITAARRWLALTVVAACMGMAASALAQTAPAVPAMDTQQRDDLLNATLWMQKSVEYKANSLALFAFAKIQLDKLLADKTFTSSPLDQKGDFSNLPPAIILDVDETLVDNSGYQAWMTIKGTSFEPKTWTAYVNSKTSLEIPGAADFCKYADSKGVKVFYVSNRTGEEKPATKENMQKLGFPMGGNVDTFLFAREQPDWGSAKSTRRAFVAKNYRIVMMMGDNFGDFLDAYRGSEAERLKAFNDNKERWGRDWIMLANPTYGSFESATFGHDFKKSQAEQRKAKRDALMPWAGPTP